MISKHNGNGNEINNNCCYWFLIILESMNMQRRTPSSSVQQIAKGTHNSIPYVYNFVH